MEPDQVTDLEDLISHAWQAEEQQTLGGWLLRANRGVTRRANSVLPTHTPTPENVEDAIAECNKFYQERGLPTLFQLTSASHPGNLDDVLREMGFKIGLQVYLQVASVTSVFQEDARHDVLLESSPSNEWMSVYAQGSGYCHESMLMREDLMLRSPLKKVFGAVIINNEIAGVGLCILEDDWGGLYNMTTPSKYRRQGVAKALGNGLSRWAASNGAKKMYLQVEIENEPALDLYRGLGFETSYKYWYRHSS